MQLLLRSNNMAPDGESVAFTSISPKGGGSGGGHMWQPSRLRSHSSSDQSGRSWLTRASLRKTLSADDGDDNNNNEEEDEEPLSCSSPMSAVHSLGVGHVSKNGRVDRFRSSKPKKSRSPLHLWPLTSSSPRGGTKQVSMLVSPSSSEHSLASSTGGSSRSMVSSNGGVPTTSLLEPTEDSMTNSKESLKTAIALKRRQSSFLRVADLAFTEHHLIIKSMNSKGSNQASNAHDEHANFSYPAINPPPGVTLDPEERWIALDDGSGSHAPVAPAAIAALAKFGLELCLSRESLWTPDHKTMKVLKSIGTTSWQGAWQRGQPITNLPPIGSAEEKEVLVWSASSLRGSGYGSDIPAVRVMGILNLSPRAMTEWLIDSNRVQEYNKMSLGRSDTMILHNDLDRDGPFGKSVTKVMKSLSRPPLLRKTLQFISLLHARALDEGPLAGGYIIVTRAVTPAAEEDEDGSKEQAPDDLLQSEIMTGVNLMLPVQDDPHRCLMININHVKSPMVPMMLAKRIGLTAAANFIQDLRAAAITAAAAATTTKR